MYNFKEVEEEVLKKWEKDKTYDKVKAKNKRGKKFYFLQGPPYTSGRIHIGHAWNNSLKDVAMRYKRMQGFNVWDRAGYDMHGLPTENAVQKKLGFKDKEEIMKYGMDKFVKECMKFSIEHAGYMNEDLWKLGVWMDYKNAYMPIKKEWIGGQWKFFKKSDEQKRLYKGMKVMHWDTQSETSLAKHELEYENVKDKSIYVAFKLKGKEGSLVIWTTTPWTLPFNLAVMANPDFDYVKVKGKDGIFYVAKDLVDDFSEVLGEKLKVLEKIKGKNMGGWEYENPFYPELKNKYDEMKKKWKNVHTVILNKEFVTTEAGTGLVHCAPGCGPEDQVAAKPYGIDVFNTLNEQGKFEDMEKYTGWEAKVDDEKFISELEGKDALIGTRKIQHEYPFSWRSHKPVVFRTTEQWFLKTEDLSKKVVSYNKKVHWVPKKAGESYEQWAKNLKDNGVTRQRFWGCPVPIWINEKNSNDYIVIGSVEELEKLTKKKFNDENLHRPWIDKITIEKQGKKYKRIPDVADVWIDSGTASWNCLYNDKKLIKEWFPADLILEGIEQTRLWFSLLDICSAVMFDKGCFKNVYAHGMLLDYQGTKMSKSLGNIISPYEVLGKYGADVLRYYMCGISAGENVNFSWEDIKMKQRNLNILDNVSRFVLDLRKQTKPNKNYDLEEKWILSRKNSAIESATKLMEDYKLDQVIEEIEKLFLDLSRTYIKLAREKVNKKDAGKVLAVVEDVFDDALRMFSIICPFITDKLWYDLGNKESVHLSSWPKADKKKIDKKLEAEFENVLKIIESGLAERDKIHTGLKWPLANVHIRDYNESKVIKYKKIIMSQLNVKDVSTEKGSGLKSVIKYDTKMTPELESEGYARELSRQIQAFRKTLGLQKKDKVKTLLIIDGELKKIIGGYEKFIGERTNSSEIKIVTTTKETFKNKTDFKIKDKSGVIAIVE